MDVQSIKQRFGIIGSSPLLDLAINIAWQVAPTDISVLVSGESGTGKEVFPQIIHQLGARKHGPYFAVNCGAIPEGTIDSELFGHEKGSFTGAHDARKGYFEVANGGTLFLDEVAELPLSTQVRLLRVLESGEFLRVGSSKVQKTNVRIIAASNVNMIEAIQRGRFREDLYYRLNTVPIKVPPLRDRKDDVLLLFRKFSNDFAEKYHMPPVQLEEEAKQLLTAFRWPGNIRQLKNITEQISIIEKNRTIKSATLEKYLPLTQSSNLPVLFNALPDAAGISERDILYKVLFEMRKDINDLKKLVAEIYHSEEIPVHIQEKYGQNLQTFSKDFNTSFENQSITLSRDEPAETVTYEGTVVLEESLSLEKKEIDMIRKALEKHKGRRNFAAKELGISERTLYRKMKEHNIAYRRPPKTRGI
jgi:transcriptional regulator with PAS, ATPase and Fis domain